MSIWAYTRDPRNSQGQGSVLGDTLVVENDIAYPAPHAYGVGFLCDQGKGAKPLFRGLPLAIPGVTG